MCQDADSKSFLKSTGALLIINRTKIPFAETQSEIKEIFYDDLKNRNLLKTIASILPIYTIRLQKKQCAKELNAFYCY